MPAAGQRMRSDTPRPASYIDAFARGMARPWSVVKTTQVSSRSARASIAARMRPKPAAIAAIAPCTSAISSRASGVSGR